MKKAIALTIMGILLTSTLLASCLQKKLPPEPDDSLKLVKDEDPDVRDTLDIFSGGKAGQLLSQHLYTVIDYSPGVARRERLSLNNLKKQDKKIRQQMGSELLAAYFRLEEGKYALRWLVVDLLAQLEINETVDALTKITLATLPPEKLVEDCHQSSTEEEVAIRLASVRGVVKLAANGHQPAEEKLVKIAEASPVRAVKIQAVWGYLLAPLKKSKSKSIDAYKRSEIYQSRLKILQKRLPAEIVSLAEIKPASAKNMAVPEDVLKATEKEEKKKAGFPLAPAPRVPETFERKDKQR